jgi:hypothetical protein
MDCYRKEKVRELEKSIPSEEINEMRMDAFYFIVFPQGCSEMWNQTF